MLLLRLKAPTRQRRSTRVASTCWGRRSTVTKTLTSGTFRMSSIDVADAHARHEAPEDFRPLADHERPRAGDRGRTRAPSRMARGRRERDAEGQERHHGAGGGPVVCRFRPRHALDHAWSRTSGRLRHALLERCTEMNVESTAAGPGTRPVRNPTTEPRAMGIVERRHSSRLGRSSRSFTLAICALAMPSSASRSTSATRRRP